MPPRRSRRWSTRCGRLSEKRRKRRVLFCSVLPLLLLLLLLEKVSKKAFHGLGAQQQLRRGSVLFSSLSPLHYFFSYRSSKTRRGARRRRCSLSLSFSLLFELALFCDNGRAGAQGARVAPDGSGGREQGAAGAGKGSERGIYRAIHLLCFGLFDAPRFDHRVRHLRLRFLCLFAPSSASLTPQRAYHRCPLRLQKHKRSKKRRQRTAQDQRATREKTTMTTAVMTTRQPSLFCPT